jgi:hypothetical protein
MFQRPNFKISWICTAGMVLMLTFGAEGMSQTETAKDTEPSSSDVQEEIIVYGKKSLVLLRHDMRIAQEHFLDVFNSLNSNDEFDFECDYVVYLGDRRRHHVCMPKFAKKLEAQMAEIMMWENTFSTPNRFQSQLKKKEGFLVVEMTTLINQDPGLRKAYTDLSEAKGAYDTERQKREDK